MLMHMCRLMSVEGVGDIAPLHVERQSSLVRGLVLLHGGDMFRYMPETAGGRCILSGLFRRSGRCCRCGQKRYYCWTDTVSSVHLAP